MQHGAGTLPRSQVRARELRAVILPGIVLLTASVCEAQIGSVRATWASSSYGGFGGVTSVDRFRRGLNAAEFFAPQARHQAALAPPRRGPQLTFDRRMGVGRDLVGAARGPSIRRQVQTNWLRRLAPSGAARYFRRGFFQSHFSSPTPGARFTGQSLLLAPQKLLDETGFWAPAQYGGMARGGVRDRLSERDQTQSPRYAGPTAPPEERRSQADLMASRLGTMRKGLLDQAWAHFEDGAYLRARSAFQSAEMLDREDPEPRAGAFFCAVAEGKYAQAVHEIRRICGRDTDADLFGVNYRLRERYVSEERLQQDLRALLHAVEISRAKADVSTGGQKGAPAAVEAALGYAMWHGGGEAARLEARHSARILKDLDPDRAGPFGRFGELLTEAWDGQTAGKSD